MKNIMLVIEYDGTNYFGWQRQPKKTTVQGEIEKAIKIISNEEVNLMASGRTDAKVHAFGHVANFHFNGRIPPQNISKALNAILPEDIAIKLSKEVDMDFHSRYSARGKTYIYRIYNCETKSPVERNYSYHVKDELDMDKMIQESKKLLGEHDFIGFSSTNSSIKTTTRRIHYIKISKQDKIIEMEITGNAFLYNMVRIIAGTLVEIGRGRIKVPIDEIIASKNRDMAGPTAPPQGLFLKKVNYLNTKNFDEFIDI